MIYNPTTVQKAFTEHLDGREPYFYWKEMPPTKIWYDETTNSFHTDVGISIEFINYNISDIGECLMDLYQKIIVEYKRKGITLHNEFPD